LNPTKASVEQCNNVLCWLLLYAALHAAYILWTWDAAHHRNPRHCASQTRWAPLLWNRTEPALSRRLGFVVPVVKGEAMRRGRFIRKEVRDGILFVLITVLMALFSVAVVIEVAEPLVA